MNTSIYMCICIYTLVEEQKNNKRALILARFFLFIDLI